MKGILKKISWTAAGILLTITAIVYVCPMTGFGVSASMNPSVSPCQSFSSAGTGAVDTPSCLSSHLTAVGRVLSDVPPQMMSILLAMASLVFVRWFFLQNFFVSIYFFHRFRRQYVRYCTTIRLLARKKLLKYLNFLDSYRVAPLL